MGSFCNTTAPEYADYNLFNNEVNQNDMDIFLFGPDAIANLQSLREVSSYEANSITMNPRFTGVQTGQFKLMNDSPVLNQGVDGTCIFDWNRGNWRR